MNFEKIYKNDRITTNKNEWGKKLVYTKREKFEASIARRKRRI